MHSGSRKRSKSRSPIRKDNFSRRREPDKKENSTNNDGTMNMASWPINNMYPGANMMMGGIYQNMMPGMMHGNMIPGNMIGANMMTPSLDMMSSGNVDIMSSMDMSGMPQVMPSSGGMDMSMINTMMMDPTMMASMYPGMSDMTPLPEIVLKTCKLSPPSADNAQPPSTRSRPPGCRTIFVGGLPELTKESHVREIFERYGRIHTLRLSNKNFCHIRFDREMSVDSSIAISGFKLKLIDKEKGEEEEENHSNMGWIHVDYAMSRDDFNEYKRKQRQALRVHQADMDQYGPKDNQDEIMSDAYSMTSHRRSRSPPKVHPYSSTSIIQISEKIKSEEHFSTTLPTLISWLERGECSKKNANQFYSMIQATNSHIRRLFNEKIQWEEELQAVKDKVKVNIELVIVQLEQVGRVFNAAMHQRVWDHFTKPQRKNIDTWQKMAQEFGNLKEEFYEKFDPDDENNDYGSHIKSNENVVNANSSEIAILRRDNESLLFQLEAYKNEVDVIKADSSKEMEKFKAQFIARQALMNAAIPNMDQPPPLPKTMAPLPPPPPLSEELVKSPLKVGCGEAKLIGVMAAFLQVHPQGASLDYVVSYVRAMFPDINQSKIHQVLQTHADVFQKKTLGVGANIEHKYFFCAFNGLAA